MAKKEKPLPASDQALIESQTKALAEELAFYARGPVRIKLTGGQHIAYTYGCDDKLHAINIVMNPSILLKIRNKERAIAIWRGIGFHELAHHLWPAEEQYKTAYEEGFKSLFNLIDDEQNERRGRAMNPSWGSCFQTVCSYIFPSKKRRATGPLSTGIPDDEEPQKDPEGMESVDEYSQRWNEFAYHFRRHLKGATDPTVLEALAMIPKRFKELSKDELLQLTREIHAVLSRGITAPPRPPKQAGTEEGKAANPGTPAPPPVLPTVVLPDDTPFWQTIITSRWSYVIMAAFVLGYAALFLSGGFQYWLEVFYCSVAAILLTAIIIAARRLHRWLIKKGAQEGKLTLKETAKASGPSRWRTIGRWLSWPFRALFWILWAIPPIRWCLRRIKAGWLLLVRGWVFSVSRIRKWWRWLVFRSKQLWRWLWSKQIFRIACVAIPFALALAMSVGAVTQAGELSWWMLVLTLLVLLALLILGWIFRKRILALLMEELLTDTSFIFEMSCDIPLDKETLAFNVLENIVPVEADPEYLKDAMALVLPIAQQLRPHMEKCGRVLVDKDNEEEGHDLVEELEQAFMGETNLFVDEVTKSNASMHIEVALDCSTSMQSPTETLKAGQKFQLGKSFALIIEEAVRNLRGVSSHFWGFSDTAIYDCGEAGQGRISGLKCQGGNNDSAMLWHMAQSAAKSGKELKILLMISDGQPSDCSWGSLHHLVEQAEQDGMIPVQIAVDTIKDPAFQRFFVDLVGQTMTEAVVTMGQTLAALVENGV